MLEDWRNGGFGLYLHWPFCQAKCPYCDFNSHVSASIDQSLWLRAYLKELDRYADLLPNRILNSVFFGGGTPSLMDPEIVAAIINKIKASWPTANDLEITLEANPTSVEAGRFKRYADAGVTRISMGVQALNDADLKRLGRLHSTKEALAAFDIARAHFDRVSFDLIYARQDQTLAQWEEELRLALSLAVDHLSLYQLTIEPGTSFGDRHNKGRLAGLPNEDLAADMFSLTQNMCRETGFESYEVSNHARVGAESRHNLIYWRYGDYVGIGPGAHGRITQDGVRCATEAWSSPSRWLTGVNQGLPEKINEPISTEDQSVEYLMMGLRLLSGVDLRRFENLAGHTITPKVLSHLEELRLITIDGCQLAVTDSGRLILNTVTKEILTATE